MIDRKVESLIVASFADAPAGDVVKEAKIFKTKCAQCHVAEKGGGHKQVEHLKSSSGLHRV